MKKWGKLDTILIITLLPNAYILLRALYHTIWGYSVDFHFNLGKSTLILSH